MSSSKRFLILNPFGIGDVLFTTPLISNLRKAYPESYIGYIANRRALPIVENNPKVNRVYIYERDDFKKNLIPTWLRFINEIRQENFDIVFDFSLNSSLSLFSMVCGIKKRIGYDFLHRGWFLTDKIPLQGYEGKHVVEYYLDLLNKINLPQTQRNLEIFIDSDHQVWAKNWMKEKGIDINKSVIAIIPGGGSSWGKNATDKRWTPAQYASLVDKIIAKTGSIVILMGDQQEQILCQKLTCQCSSSVYDAVGKTTLLQMAALLQLCRLAIVNDGGPLHVAVAVGIKTVSIFGPVDPVVYGPYPSEGHVVIKKNLACQPCYRQFRKAACEHLSCLNQLETEEVYRKVETLL